MSEELALPEGARFVLAGTVGWPVRSGSPVFEVGGLPGARVVLDATRGDDARFVRVACVTAPTDRWAPGLEDTVLGYATWIAHKSLGPEPIRLAAGALERGAASPGCEPEGCAGGGDPSHIRQSLSSAEPAWSVAGSHELGFVGAPPLGLICSLACVERSPMTSDACARVARESHIEATFRGEPPPSVVVRAALWVGDHPLGAGAALATLGFALAAAWVSRRPRWA